MLALNKIKGVIFDLDGVLVDTEYYQSKAWIEVLKNYGIFLSQREMSDYKGKSGEVIEEQIKRKYALKIKKGELVQKRNEIVLKIFKKQKVKTMPYVKRTLNFFKKRNKLLAVASTGIEEEVLLKLKKAGIFSYFSAITSKSEVKRGKPYPDVYFFATKKINLKPNECLAIEDTQSGVESAKSAGLFCFAIPNEYSFHQDFSKADKVFKNLKEVIDFFRKSKELIVCWDFDGTLVDTMASHVKLASELINKYFGLSKEKARREYLKTTGLPFDIQLKIIFPKKDKNTKKLCAKEYHKRKLNEVYKNFKSIPNAKYAIYQLFKLGVFQIVTSGTDEDIVYYWIKKEKITGINKVMGREQGLKADHIKEIKKKFKNTLLVLVSDSVKDMKLPADFKIGFVLKRNLKTKEGAKRYKELKKEANIVISDLKKVPAIIKEWIKNKGC